MDFEGCVHELNKVLSEENPKTFNSSWILERIPWCYRFIQKNVRSEIGAIDWDSITYALEWKFQRRWVPGQKRRIRKPYKDALEVELALSKYREKLYVFIAPADQADRRTRDIISITLVRLAQNGNIIAKEKVMELVSYTIEDWLERYCFLSRWRGYNDAVKEQLERCIRRYRYTGSFLNYVYRTLELAGRGIRPFYAYSLDEPVAGDAEKRKVEDVVQDAESGEITLYQKTP
jgi:hypothetical protein